MIFFGHLGLTTLAFKAYEKIDKKNNSEGKTGIDYRFVLAGSVLPDIIDKPIGAWLFRGTFHNSRIFAHTLLFTVVLLLIGIYFWNRRRNSSFILLGTSSLIHLILDSMWLYPAILFWPYFGLRFPERPEGDWIKSDIIRLITDPSYFLPEIIGFIIIAYYFIRLIKNKRLREFINTGRL